MSSHPGQRFDVVVVGSGPGGATVARELTRRGARVLILEWGPGRPERGTWRDYVSRQLVPGRSLLVTNGLLGVVRGITTGGSSIFYYATAYPVPFGMLAARGVEIADEVAEARDELPVAPLTDALISPLTQRIMGCARDLGLDWRPLDKIMFQDRWRPEYRFGYYGDPHHVKWSARMFVEEAVSRGATLVNRARVTRVLVDRGIATGVEYRRAGRARRVSADTVVVAAGGIGSPLILRASGISEAGFDFFFDPLVTVSGTVRDVSARISEIPMSTGASMREDGYMITDMAVPPLVNAIFEAQVGRLDKIGSVSSTARIMVKARDALGGRVTTRGGVRKKLSPSDRAALDRGAETARRILRHMGATGVHRSWFLGAHPGGTVKLGELVDGRLMTRIANLHVCDCSVIPEAWGLPPTLTLVGLGKHLARVLAGEKRLERSAAAVRPGAA